MICREAATFWHEATTDGHVSMRPRINAELAAVAEEIDSGGLTWCQRNIKRLITPYPPRKEVDQILAKLGEDFYHDEIQDILGNEDHAAVADDAAVADLDDSISEPDEHALADDAAVADDAKVVHDVDTAVADGHEGEGMAIIPSLSASQADEVQRVEMTIAGLESTIESLRAIGSVSGVQSIELELKKERRRKRQLVKESPAVAEAFLQRRRAEEQNTLARKRLAAQMNEQSRKAAKAIADRDAAVAELKRHKSIIQEMESIRACKHAIKTFTVEALGEDSHNAGGAKARTRRFEVLDRLARFRAGLSPGQKNDWQWFKESWDQAMVAEHGKNWGSKFAGWMQQVLDDERSNAFSCFVHTETCRVFHGIAALHVPGI